ncbi:hypothetical protein HDV05_006363 [Chytridiales sp. JEL 0842]|nr:hypothetical protein HDV05_006363 [Chytridiales sp. JEL 0842]
MVISTQRVATLDDFAFDDDDDEQSEVDTEQDAHSRCNKDDANKKLRTWTPDEDAFLVNNINRSDRVWKEWKEIAEQYNLRKPADYLFRSKVAISKRYNLHRRAAPFTNGSYKDDELVLLQTVNWKKLTSVYNSKRPNAYQKLENLVANSFKSLNLDLKMARVELEESRKKNLLAHRCSSMDTLRAVLDLRKEVEVWKAEWNNSQEISSLVQTPSETRGGKLDKSGNDLILDWILNGTGEGPEDGQIG